jgi:hydroxyacylglutathione hydrolase
MSHRSATVCADLTGGSPTILKQYYLGCLAHASYLIADETSGMAVVVDPQRDVDGYLEDAEQLGCRIGHVFLTHFHADFVAGHLELRDRVGAVIRIGARARAEYEFTPMGDGDTLALGAVRLEVLETPGHSPESISIVVYDGHTDHPDQPHAVLTGDTLFIGDVGRPDLRAALGWSAQELAGMLYDSLHDKLLTLPDDILVYPAHGAGSLCGKNLSTDTVSTLGVQRAYNYALQPMSKQRFTAIVTADQPDTPPYFAYDAVLNTREHETRPPLLRPMSLEELLAAQESATQTLDTRDGTDFEGAHLRGSVNIGLGGAYATWCGTVLDQQRPIAIIAEPGREQESAMRLARIGFDAVAGYLDGGMQALERHPQLVQRIERVTAGSLAEQLRSSDPPVVVDVRTPQEWTQAHIEGSINVPLSRLRERADELPASRPIVVLCASGYRSAIACSVLKRDGLDRVADLVGGLAGWQSSQLTTSA